jgi:DNA-binding NtrC family response regulator
MCRASLTDFMTTELGHNVTYCVNGTMALKEFKKNHYDLIISDIRMPKMDGLEFLKSVRKLDQGQETKVILITGHADLNVAIQAIRLHAFDFLQKPVSINELASIIKKLQNKENISKECQLMGEVCI